MLGQGVGGACRVDPGPPPAADWLGLNNTCSRYQSHAQKPVGTGLPPPRPARQRMWTAVRWTTPEGSIAMTRRQLLHTAKVIAASAGTALSAGRLAAAERQPIGAPVMRRFNEQRWALDKHHSSQRHRLGPRADGRDDPQLRRRGDRRYGRAPATGQEVCRYCTSFRGAGANPGSEGEGS